MKGVRRGSTKVDDRQPITGEILGVMIRSLSTVTSSSYEALLYEAAFSLAFFGFLRISEFTSTSKHSREAEMLLISDIKANAVNVTISLRHSKSNQFGRPQVIKLSRSINSQICPVQAVSKFIAVRPTQARPFLCHFDSNPLTRYEFQAMLKKVKSFTGLANQRITSHSFRIGAATTAAAKGWSQEAIQSSGRWRNESYRRYIRPTAATNTNVLN
jgi:hypothetical protein